LDKYIVNPLKGIINDVGGFLASFSNQKERWCNIFLMKNKVKR